MLAHLLRGGRLCLLVGLALCLGACPDPIDTDPPDVPVAQEVFFTVKTGYDPVNQDGAYATRDIVETQETDRDCLPTVLRMWLKYLRNVSYREGWLAAANPEAHFDWITGKLSTYTDTVRSGLIECEYEATTYDYDASLHGTEQNSLDWVKWDFATDDIWANFSGFGTFVVHDPDYDPAHPEYIRYYESHLVLTGDFIGHLADKLFANSFRCDYLGFGEDPVEELWGELAGYYEYGFDYQWVSEATDIYNYALGDETLPDFIVSDDADDFAYQIARWIAFDDDMDHYVEGDNPVDRAVIVVTDPDGTRVVSGLHYMLLTRVDVRIPAGDPKDWAHAELETFYLEDPAYGGNRFYDPDAMEAVADLRDSAGDKIFRHACLALYVGEKSLGRYQKGVRSPAEIAQVDWQAKVRYYADNWRRDRLRRILPAIMLLLDEE